MLKNVSVRKKKRESGKRKKRKHNLMNLNEKLEAPILTLMTKLIKMGR